MSLGWNIYSPNEISTCFSNMQCRNRYEQKTTSEELKIRVLILGEWNETWLRLLCVHMNSLSTISYIIYIHTLYICTKEYDLKSTFGTFDNTWEKNLIKAISISSHFVVIYIFYLTCDRPKYTLHCIMHIMRVHLQNNSEFVFFSTPLAPWTMKYRINHHDVFEFSVLTTVIRTTIKKLQV